ncbi:MAG: YicC/YloC family endoribonuclease, partial [Pirellulaceae bacterium]
MTGQGIATQPCGLPGVGDRMHVVAEVRSVNHRFLKIHARLDDALSRLEPEMESLVRTRIRRGSLQVTLRLEGEAGEPSYRINEEILARYCQQAIKVSLQIHREIELGHCLALPGVISGGQKVWEVDSPQMEAARKTLLLAIDQLQQMRLREGEW